MGSNEIGLADLITALHELPWQDEAQQKAIFHALGFAWQEISPVPPQLQRPNTSAGFNRYQRNQAPTPAKDVNNKRAAEPPKPSPKIELPHTLRQSQLKTIEPDSALPQDKRPSWLVSPPEQNLLSYKNHPEFKLPRATLFPALTQRGIVAAAINVQAFGKTIDLPALVVDLVKGQVPKKLPFHKTKSLEHGCRLLLDYSDSMTPYWEDLSSLIRQFENLLNNERLTCYQFEEDPNASECISPNALAETWYSKPKRPIVVATDFGITGQKRRNTLSPAWRKFIKICKNQHIPLVILIPWPPEFWPCDLDTYPLLISWSQNTTAAMVSRLVGKGHELVL